LHNRVHNTSDRNNKSEVPKPNELWYNTNLCTQDYIHNYVQRVTETK